MDGYFHRLSPLLPRCVLLKFLKAATWAEKSCIAITMNFVSSTGVGMVTSSQGCDPLQQSRIQLKELLKSQACLSMGNCLGRHQAVRQFLVSPRNSSFRVNTFQNERRDKKRKKAAETVKGLITLSESLLARRGGTCKRLRPPTVMEITFTLPHCINSVCLF
jgi:hypothetical protein